MLTNYEHPIMGTLVEKLDSVFLFLDSEIIKFTDFYTSAVSGTGFLRVLGPTML